MRYSPSCCAFLFVTILLSACQKEEDAPLPPPPPPPAPTASFICVGPFSAGDSTLFTNQSTNATSYKWEFGDGSTSTVAAPVHIYSQPGQYTVKLTATNSGGAQSQEKGVTLYLLPAGSTCNCKVITYTRTTPRTRLPDRTIAIGSYGANGIAFDQYDYALLNSNSSGSTYRSTVFAASIGGEANFVKATDSLTVGFHSGGIGNPTYLDYHCKRK